jgi:hypothetical protein
VDDSGCAEDSDACFGIGSIGNGSALRFWRSGVSGLCDGSQVVNVGVTA